MLATSKIFRLVLSTVCCLLALGCGSGCVTEGGKPKPVRSASSRGGEINEINLLAVPVALNFDQAPGPDGFVVKVYASAQNRPKPVPIENGKVEVVMYDGMIGLTGPGSLHPLRVWSFTADNLKPFQIESSIGTGYQLAPLWGNDKPTNDKITIVVRYYPPKGNPISSAPSVISTSAK
jgi:hypothetical protein